MILVNLSNLAWVAGRHKRNESIFRQLVAATPELEEGYFINPAVYWTGKLSRLCGSAKLTTVENALYGRRPVQVLQSRCNLLTANSEMLTAWFARQIAGQFRRRYLAGRPYALWMNSIGTFQFYLAKQLMPGASWRVFDNSDDFVTFAQESAAGERRLGELLRACDRVLYVNEHLAAKYPHPGGLVFANGISSSAWQRREAPCRLEPWFPKPAGRKYVMYAGGIHSNRMDMELLRFLFMAFPDAHFLFAGYTNDPNFIASLTGFANCSYLGELDFQDLLSILRQSDAAIVPHLDNEHTRGNDLLKLLDYGACELPIVSTRSSNVDRFAGLLQIADSPEQFAGLLAEALRPDRPAALAVQLAAMRQFAAGMTWEAKVPKIIPELFSAPRAEGTIHH